ncbi:hypothetical protein OOJ91_12390 [Micromonospora lupini]|uniref:hypothetical protein n=1 Tax=Micromonospora lupini TaxID=285679 RepID=UPI00225769E4|nr:hypothetical protein [Micromonospora lupini]MCX5066678.1 hypothetical protein [Micromonospora lupini]
MSVPTNLPAKVTIFGREPAVLIMAAASVLALFVAFGADFLTAKQAGAAEAVLAAAASTWLAFKVRPLAPTLFVGLITTCATLAAAYGFELNQEQVGSITAASIALMTALVIRPQSTPTADPRTIDGVVVAGDVRMAYVRPTSRLR